MSNSPNLNELEQKNEILKKEILEKNHDQNAFINFCLSKKENGDDLNNWNLQELKKIIEEFTLTQKEKENKTNEYQKNINAENIVNSMEKIDTSHLKVGEKKSIKTIIIQCKKLEKTILNDKKVNIIIRKQIEHQSKNILKSRYII